MDINNKVVIVTGGIGGIGFVTVQYLLKNGAKYVAILDLPQPEDAVVVDNLKTLEQEFNKGVFGYYNCDVSDEKQFAACYERVLELENYVDILVNNAGVANDTKVELMINVNFKAVVQGTTIAIDHMDKRKGYKGGVVVNIGSFLGLVNNPTLSPLYNATKHAVVSFVRSLKVYNKIFGVRVVCLCPGMTKTSMIAFDPSKKEDMFQFGLIDEIFKQTLELYQQKPENIAAAIVEIIRKGGDGDVWLAQNDEPAFAVGEELDVNKLRILF